VGTHHSLVDDDDLYRELAATQLLAAEPAEHRVSAASTGTSAANAP
jgi:ATP-binding cassette subfamily B protein/ATP-binding cassette subfamily C protein